MHNTQSTRTHYSSGRRSLQKCLSLLVPSASMKWLPFFFIADDDDDSVFTSSSRHNWTMLINFLFSSFRVTEAAVRIDTGPPSFQFAWSNEWPACADCRLMGLTVPYEVVIRRAYKISTAIIITASTIKHRSYEPPPLKRPTNGAIFVSRRESRIDRCLLTTTTKKSNVKPELVSQFTLKMTATNPESSPSPRRVEVNWKRRPIMPNDGR